jgi:predicted TIM-barrel fold metal-dependent hydrolase
LAGEFPEQIFVLDHLGSPLLADLTPAEHPDEIKRWHHGMEALSSLPNVMVKIGGLAMALHGAPWPRGSSPSSSSIASHWASDVHWCIDTFGPARCMFESNFPVDGLTVDYATLWNSYKMLAAPYSPDERRRLLHDTAVTTYSIVH